MQQLKLHSHCITIQLLMQPVPNNRALASHPVRLEILINCVILQI